MASTSVQRSEPEEDTHVTANPKKTSRENTTEEKRKMRNCRKKRKRSAKRQSIHAALQKELEEERKVREKSDKRVVLYRRMSRSFWERWQWELRQRKDAIVSMISQRRGHTSSTAAGHAGLSTQVQEIDHTLLHDPVEGEVYVGRGSFGVVKLQMFRGMMVAVKELLPRTLLPDVQREASVLAKLCHPFVPYLFGVCTTVKPYRIVIQFHGIGKRAVSLTLSKAICNKNIKEDYAWLGLCAQIMEALDYLHEEASVLHNDLTGSNILVTDCLTQGDSGIQIVIIDFGKATSVDNGKTYSLSGIEKAEYTRNFPQMAPEVVEGLTRQTKWSDIYAAGVILHNIIYNGLVDHLPKEQKEEFSKIAYKCCSMEYSRRPSAKKALQCLQQIM